MVAPPLVEVRGLTVVARKGGADVPIVKDVSFSIPKGEVLALIGESGSGKTTIALTMLGYARRGCRVAGGSIRIGDTRVLELGDEALYELRGRKVSYIAQSAAAAFNPMKTIMDQVVEGAVIHGTATRAAAAASQGARSGSATPACSSWTRMRSTPCAAERSRTSRRARRPPSIP